MFFSVPKSTDLSDVGKILPGGETKKIKRSKV